ncbi:response regulator transcription factor [Nocardioides sp. J2M5]|uniref:response regulator transcription factor n=1 Tax=Nocardioides palaemonis TaxID=2829810 RepID=UPI001BA463DE|nr:response regulator transcription factor [Nocardioides palaemonis]MBS2936367.1 response regulator transcription factor [Nocardioides palaemonis]
MSEVEGTERTRVLVVDDHRTFTDLVCMAIAADDDLECVGAAHDAAGARAMTEDLRPDIVIMDVRLGTDDGLSLTRELVARHPLLRVVVLTAEPGPVVLRNAAAAGASALLPKDGAFEDLREVLVGPPGDGLVVAPALLRTLVLDGPDESAPVERPSLTPQEERVIRLLAAGRDVRSISRELNISVHTCRGYVKSLLHKLHAHSQLEAVAAARSAGIVP